MNLQHKVANQQGGYDQQVSTFKLNLCMLDLRCFAFRKFNSKAAQLIQSASFDIRATWKVKSSKLIRWSTSSRPAGSSISVTLSESSQSAQQPGSQDDLGGHLLSQDDFAAGRTWQPGRLAANQDDLAARQPRRFGSSRQCALVVSVPKAERSSRRSQRWTLAMLARPPTLVEFAKLTKSANSAKLVRSAKSAKPAKTAKSADLAKSAK